MKDRFRRIFTDHADTLTDFAAENIDTLAIVADLCVNAMENGRKIFFFGNGGSAADAQHLAAEFVNRFEIERRPLAALALTTDTSVLTSIGNDRGFAEIFSRQIEALGGGGDIAVGLSTSGRSPNVLAALRTARSMGLITVAFTGGDGGGLVEEAHHAILVSSSVTARVQEMHILAGHALCAAVESACAGAVGTA